MGHQLCVVRDHRQGLNHYSQGLADYLLLFWIKWVTTTLISFDTGQNRFPFLGVFLLINPGASCRSSFYWTNDMIKDTRTP